MSMNIDGKLSALTTELGKAQQSLTRGLQQEAHAFDTHSARTLFNTFSLALTLKGADSGAAVLQNFSAQIEQLPEPQQRALRGLLGDARELQAMHLEVDRLTGLKGVQALLARVAHAPIEQAT